MSTRAVFWAAKQHPGTSSRKLVLLALATFASPEGVTRAANAKVSAFCSFSERTVRTALAELETAGYCTRVRRFADDGRQLSDTITLDMNRADEVVVEEGGRGQQLPPPPAAVAPLCKTPPVGQINTPSSKAAPQKKGSRPKIEWSLNAEGIAQVKGEVCWRTHIFYVLLPALIRTYNLNNARPMSLDDAKKRAGAMVKRKGAFETAQALMKAAQAEPGGNPFDYAAGAQRAQAHEDDMARKAMFAPIDY